jgi:hypothetical protein
VVAVGSGERDPQAMAAAKQVRKWQDVEAKLGDLAGDERSGIAPPVGVVRYGRLVGRLVTDLSVDRPEQPLADVADPAVGRDVLEVAKNCPSSAVEAI